MKFWAGCLIIAGLVGMSTPAAAMTIGRTPPHKRDYAICETRQLVDYINSTWAWLNDESQSTPDPIDMTGQFIIYSDDLGGRVGRLQSPYHPNPGDLGDEDDWIESLRTASGKPDQGPIVASRLTLLQGDKTLPVYLVTLQRKAWVSYALYQDMEEYDGYQTVDSTWMMQFRGNEIRVLRQVEELDRAAKRGPNLLTRKVDCAKLKADASKE